MVCTVMYWALIEGDAGDAEAVTEGGPGSYQKFLAMLGRCVSQRGWMPAPCFLGAVVLQAYEYVLLIRLLVVCCKIALGIGGVSSIFSTVCMCKQSVKCILFE